MHILANLNKTHKTAEAKVTMQTTARVVKVLPRIRTGKPNKLELLIDIFKSISELTVRK
jgi:hypothetical protein